MDVRSSGTYPVADRELVAEGADLRVQVLTLTAGQRVPWHYHSEITDRIYCLEGLTVVDTRAPTGTHELAPGQDCTISPMTAHSVHGRGDGPCKFLIVQGVGTYDYQAVDG